MRPSLRPASCLSSLPSSRSARSASAPRVVLALLGALALAATPACKSRQGQASSRAEDQVRLSDSGLTMISEGGTFALGDGTKVPDDFPKAVPIYPGAHVTMAARSPGASGKGTWSLTFDTTDPMENVVAYYKAHMPGFTQASDLAMGDTQMTVWQSAKLDVTLLVASNADAGTALTMTVAGK